MRIKNIGFIVWIILVSMLVIRIIYFSFTHIDMTDKRLVLTLWKEYALLIFLLLSLTLTKRIK